MPYQTGTASTEDDLLQALATFAAANGWTVDLSQADGADGWRLHLHRSDQWVALKTTRLDATFSAWNNGTGHHLLAAGCTGFNGSVAWDAQPGVSPYHAYVADCGGPYQAYHFLMSADYNNVYVGIEVSPGVWKTFGFGLLDLVGAGAGQSGAWVAASTLQPGSTPDAGTTTTMCESHYTYQPGTYPGNHVRLNVDGSSGWLPMTSYNQSSRCVGTFRLAGFDGPIWACTPSAWNTAAVLPAAMIFALRPSGYWSLVGTMRNLSWLRDASAYTPGDQIQLGADNWMVVPLLQIGSTQSGNYAYAIKVES